MLHMAYSIDQNDPLLMSDAERRAFLTPIPMPNLGEWFVPGVAAARFRYVSRLRGWLAPDGNEPTDEDIEAAAAPILTVMEIFVPPDASYDVLDLDPDIYRIGISCTEAEAMDAPPINWDDVIEGAAA